MVQSLTEAEQPLLAESTRRTADPEAGNASSSEAAKDSTWSADLKDIVQLAGPAILQLSFQQAVIVTNQSMAGHLGPNELAAAAIAVTWFNLMWFFIIGASSALDTLASQAYGAGDTPGVIIWAVASSVFLSIMAIPMAIALYVADSVASVIFQQPEHISELVAIYCRGILPGLLPFIWSLIIMKAMQAQNLMWGPTLVTVGMFVANIFINLGFIKLYGFTGAAYAQSASRIALFLFLIVYVTTFGRGCIQFDRPAWRLEEDGNEEEVHVVPAHSMPPSPFTEEISQSEQSLDRRRIHDSAGSSPPGKAYEDLEDPPFSHLTFRECVREGCSRSRLLAFSQLGIAGGMMMAADASSFDISTAMAGFIGVEAVGAHTSLLTVVEFIFTSFPYGIATAATIRVGNMLGAGKATSARQSAYLCLAGCACFNITIMLLFFVFGKYVGYIFTNDPKVVHIVARLSILAGLYQIPDCVYGSVSGILRGTGRQASLMWSNLAGFWGVGMPVCYLLAFRFGFGVKGLWIGLVTGLSCSALLVLIMLLMLDWDKEAEKAQQLSLAQREDGDDEAAGGDTFPNASTQPVAVAGDVGERSLQEASRTLPIQRSSSLPMHRARSHSQLSVGSLTGSYARPMNSHL